MRYDRTERLGVNETERIVIKEIDWIFREQPIVDVGLDAIIEESIDGSPTGKFLAVQIKTGRSNFLISDKTIIYYVSNIHYNYWLNLCIPIILIAHFPDTGATYWQQISERTFKKTKKQWKIEIPKNQLFNLRAKAKLVEILSNKTDKSFVFELYKGKVEPDTIFDIAENVNCISEAVKSTKKFIGLLMELKENSDRFNLELRQLSDRGLSHQDHEVKASIKGFARHINISSKRIENEIVVFSELYSVGFYAYEQVILLNYFFGKDIKEIEEAKRSIEVIPASIVEALIGINSMREGAAGLPNKFAILKEAKLHLLDVIDMIITEYNDAILISENIIKNLNIEK